MAKIEKRARQYARSGSVRKIYRTTPGGVTRVLLRRRKKSVVSCEICGREVSRIRGDGRVFGGAVCPQDLEKVISYYTRVIDGVLRPEAVDLRYQKYVSMLLKKQE